VLHFVLGYDEEHETGHVVTTCLPDADDWEPDWRTRRNR